MSQKEKIRICFIGCGRFARSFIPLFKAHPSVEKVYVCDLIPERAKDYSEKFDVEIIDSFEEAIASDKINSVAIFTQRYTHGDLVIAALKAGKNVYSAVPCSISVEKIMEIERLVRETRLVYSMGETGAYRAATVFCRREFKKGTFGKFVWGEAQYNHDIAAMEDSFQHTEGENYKRFAGIPPFFYPTHSTAMLLSAMPGEYIKRVTAMGFRGSPRTDIFGEDVNNFNNPFANTAMLAELAGGGVVRISENRCLAWAAPETFINQFYGTEGSYEFSVGKHHLATRKEEPRTKMYMKDVTEELLPASVYDVLKEDYALGIQKIADGAGYNDAAPVQPTARLPKEFEGMRNGHNGTHHFLVDDFCRAYDTGKLSPCNIWAVARYNIPGLIAHQSALQGGVPMDVPDLGEPPADWEVLDFDS